MSYQFFSESEIHAATGMLDSQLSITPSTAFSSDINLDGSHLSSQAEEFIYKAELTNSYLDKGYIDINDQFNAEQKAMLNGFQSDMAFNDWSMQEIDTQAGQYIRDASLLDSYNEKGYLDFTDSWEANNQAALQGPLEDYKFYPDFDYGLSPGGEFIRDAQILDTFMENGTWEFGDIQQASLDGLMESHNLGLLFWDGNFKYIQLERLRHL